MICFQLYTHFYLLDTVLIAVLPVQILLIKIKWIMVYIEKINFYLRTYRWIVNGQQIKMWKVKLKLLKEASSMPLE